MERPDLENADRPVDEIEKATDDFKKDDKKARPGTTADNQAEMRPTGSGGSAPPQS